MIRDFPEFVYTIIITNKVIYLTFNDILSYAANTNAFLGKEKGKINWFNKVIKRTPVAPRG